MYIYIEDYQPADNGYRTVIDIAAERSFVPSSFHLDWGAVAPATIAFAIDMENEKLLLHQTYTSRYT